MMKTEYGDSLKRYVPLCCFSGCFMVSWAQKNVLPYKSLLRISVKNSSLPSHATLSGLINTNRAQPFVGERQTQTSDSIQKGTGTHNTQTTDSSVNTSYRQTKIQRGDECILAP